MDMSKASIGGDSSMIFLANKIQLRRKPKFKSKFIKNEFNQFVLAAKADIENRVEEQEKKITATKKEESYKPIVPKTQMKK